MTFIVGKIAFILLHPSNLLLILGLLGLAGLWRRPRAWAKATLAAVLGGMLLASLLPVGGWPKVLLEDRFPRPMDYPERIDGAVVLGGTITPHVMAARGVPAVNDAAERLTEMFHLARRYPAAEIIFTGGVGRLGGGVPPEAAAVGRLLEQEGLAGRVLLDQQARSTRENALNAKRLAGPGPGEVWLLVTSAAHMPRAVGVFREVGWDVTAWPVDYRTAGGLRREWDTDPSLGGALAALDEGAKEWLGLAYYRALGWTPAFFPRP